MKSRDQVQTDLGAETQAASAIELGHITRLFRNTAAVNDVSLSIKPGEIVCLVGQSGCGKSTLLRIIAGVDSEHGGTVSLFGKVAAADGVYVQPEDRRVGFMFQDYALFPHLTAFENIMFGVRRRKDGARLAAATIERLRIGSLRGKYPHMLSGGEQQRVALARALAPQPPVLLMDEPFSNLDRRLGEAIRTETLAILRELNTTAIIVTHDPEEALASSDRIALMRNGKIVQVGTGYELYYHPNSRYTADYFCAYNKVPATYRQGSLDTVIGAFPASFQAKDGSPATLYIRPQSISVSLEGNGIACRILSRTFRGDAEHLVLAVVDTDLVLTAQIPYLLPEGNDLVRVVVPSIGMLAFQEHGDRIQRTSK